MKAQDSDTEALERRARELLESSTERLDGRVRSRLTQARFAAVEEARRARHRSAWRTCGRARCCGSTRDRAVEWASGDTDRNAGCSQFAR